MRRLSCGVVDDVVGMVCAPRMRWLPGAMVVSVVKFVVVELLMPKVITVGDTR